ncbi:Hypothetical_protein [Hexamita inflata]|uniref:Hypothetical_protein n=1 Tax=Hexamita inflata TaxID=28002 RepID=A0AA86RKQ1_9EUKA|nr:Hypothetical protein HINF_LOCUS61297 [Hexamita inflata]CAI9973656.1 Hypothetical protein HINF_LOCUS61301 [Hexamita inflata]
MGRQTMIEHAKTHHKNIDSELCCKVQPKVIQLTCVTFVVTTHAAYLITSAPSGKKSLNVIIPIPSLHIIVLDFVFGDVFQFQTQSIVLLGIKCQLFYYEQSELW